MPTAVVELLTPGVPWQAWRRLWRRGWLEEVLARLPLAWLSVGAATGMWWVGPWDGRCRSRGGLPFLPWS